MPPASILLDEAMRERRDLLDENGRKLHIAKSNDAGLVTTVTVKGDTTDRPQSDYWQSFAL